MDPFQTMTTPIMNSTTSTPYPVKMDDMMEDGELVDQDLQPCTPTTPMSAVPNDLAIVMEAAMGYEEEEDEEIAKPSLTITPVATDDMIAEHEEVETTTPVASIPLEDLFKFDTRPGLVIAENSMVVERDDDDDDEEEQENVEKASESDSEESSSESDSDSDTGMDSDEHEALAKGIDEMEDEVFDDDEEGGATTGPLRTKNELSALPPVEPVDVPIPETATLHNIGKIHGIVEDMIIITGSASGDVRVLDEGSVLVFEDRTILGRVFDTFGPVQNPMYSVRVPDLAALPDDINGKDVFFVPDYAKFVFTHALRNFKGTDASNMYDEEIPEEEQEFSDDEKESEHKRKAKMAKRKNKQPQDGQEGSQSGEKGQDQQQRARATRGGHRGGRGGARGGSRGGYTSQTHYQHQHMSNTPMMAQQNFQNPTSYGGMNPSLMNMMAGAYFNAYGFPQQQQQQQQQQHVPQPTPVPQLQTYQQQQPQQAAPQAPRARNYGPTSALTQPQPQQQAPQQAQAQAQAQAWQQYHALLQQSQQHQQPQAQPQQQQQALNLLGSLLALQQQQQQQQGAQAYTTAQYAQYQQPQQQQQPQQPQQPQQQNWSAFWGANGFGSQ